MTWNESIARVVEELHEQLTAIGHRLAATEAREARLRAVIDTLFMSHANLYKAHFGESADPMNDLVVREALVVLADPTGQRVAEEWWALTAAVEVLRLEHSCATARFNGDGVTESCEGCRVSDALAAVEQARQR